MLTLLILSLTAGSATAKRKAASAAPTTQALFNEAKVARAGGDLLRAVRLLNQIYEREPSPSLLNNLGKLYEGLGWYREAVEAYQKVADDSSADIGLRSLDASRIAALRPLLGKAWLKLKDAPPNVLVWLDGQPVGGWSGREVSAAPGSHLLEMRIPGATETLIVRLDLPVARRTLFSPDSHPTPAGVVLLPPAPSPWSNVTLNGVSLGAPATALRTLLLPPGPLELQVRFPTHTHRETLNVVSGETLGVTWTQPSASPAPKPSLRPPPGSSWPMWVGLGVSAAALGTGTWLWVDGSLQASALNDALATEDPVTSFSLEEAQEIREDANLKVPLGMGLAILGVAAVTTMCVLAFSGSDEPPETSFSLVPALDGSVHLFVSF